MTDRQTEILNAIIETYARTAEPIGSLALSRSFGVSPATIRAEMVELEKAGFITHPHTSAGRIPTDKGYRAYVNTIGQERSDGRLGQVIAKRVASAGQVDRAIKAAAASLSQATSNLSLATLADSLYFTGIASLFAQPEFFGTSRAFEVARLLDSLEEWLQEASPHDRLNVYIGHENPIGKDSGCSLIVARFQSPFSDHSYIGVLGPTRQSYGRVINLVDYAGRLLEESLS